jgi:uncharacterized protein (TIGR02302 family)
MTTTSDATRSHPGSAERYVALARGALIWERVWPALWPATGIAALYLAAALFGLIERVPPALHGLVQAFTLACIAFVAYENFRGLRLPSWIEGARRVERDSRLAHRPISESGDRLAAGLGDAQAEALWRLHLKQLLARIANLRVARPTSGLKARDPHALRFVLLVLLLAGLLFAGSDWARRLEAALAPGTAMGASNAGMDAWIDPPTYTGMAPLYLARGETRTIAVPVGSMLEVRVHDAAVRPHFAIDPSPDGTPSFAGGHKEYGAGYRIAASGSVRVRADGRVMGDWRITAIPDKPPTIAFTQPLSRTPHDAVKFAFSAGDDYGVIGVRALIRAVLPKGRSGKTMAVDLPLSNAGKRIDETIFRDLTENPFAGLDVTVALEARDASGQTGVSKPMAFHMPARIFTNPLARALVEQRQILAVDAHNARETVEEMLDALSIAPQIFYKDQNAAWLAQRTIFHALTTAKTPADMARVEDLLWQTALSLDQAGLADAAEQLRRLEQMLSQALAQGAPQDVIDALLQRYREAMQKYLQLLAQSAKPGGQNSGQAMNISPDDLDKLLKALEDAAKSGSRQSANAMLSMLQNLLENLHMQQGGSGGGFGGDKALSDAIQGLSDLLGRQRELLDKTYRQGQGTGDPKDGGPKGLAQQQGKLKDDLDKALKGLKQQKGKTPDSLGQAGREMGDAQGALGANALDGAQQAQKNALEDMRKGVGDLANQLMAEQGNNAGQGANEDPLGRGLDNNGNVKVPDKSTLERARSILQELRRRAAQQGRPKRELDYIDRLLKEF